MRKYKPYIDVITNTIISSNKKLKNQFDKFQDILEMRDIELTKAYQRSKLDVTGQLLKDKVILDIYRRLGNIVLYQVREIRKEQDSAVFQAKTRAQQKRIEKNKRKILVNRCFQLNDLVNHEIISAFEEFQEKLKNANWSRLREEGYLD